MYTLIQGRNSNLRFSQAVSLLGMPAAARKEFRAYPDVPHFPTFIAPVLSLIDSVLQDINILRKQRRIASDMLLDFILDDRQVLAFQFIGD
jgi:hypothetical protein